MIDSTNAKLDSPTTLPDDKFDILRAQLDPERNQTTSSGLHDFPSIKKPTDLVPEAEDGKSESAESSNALSLESGGLNDFPSVSELENKEPEQVSEVEAVTPLKSEVVSPTELVPTNPVEASELVENIDFNLEKAREEYASKLVEWKNEIRKKKNLFSRTLSDLGVDKQLPETEEPEELQIARFVYIEAKKKKNKKLVEAVKEVPNQNQKPLGIAQAERDSNAEVLTDAVQKEYELLQSKIGEGIPPLERGLISKGLEKWSKVSAPKRILISTAIMTVTFGLLSPVGVASYAGMRLARGVAGTASALGVGRAVDIKFKIDNEKNQKENLENYTKGINLENFEQKEKEIMSTFEKVENQKKRQRLYKAAAMVTAGGIASANVGSVESALVGSDIPPALDSTPSVDGPKISESGPVLPDAPKVSPESLNSGSGLENLEQLKPDIKSEGGNILETQVELSSKGFIQDIHNLKANILAEYNGRPIPDSLQKNILNKPSIELAKQFHFYDAETNSSGIGLKGEHLGLDKDGNIFYEHLDGKKQIIFDARTGEIGGFEGEMQTPVSDFAKTMYPNAEIGDGVSKVDFSPKTEVPEDIFAENRAGVDFIPKAETLPVEIAPEEPIVLADESTLETSSAPGLVEDSSIPSSKITLENGKSVDVMDLGGKKFVSYEGLAIGHEEVLNGKKILVLDDQYQEGSKYSEVRGVFAKAFEKTIKTDVVGPEPIAESFEGGRIYVIYNVPGEPEKISILLNGKEIAAGNMNLVKDGIPKIEIHKELKGGWFLADNAYERAFNHIKSLIKNNPSIFKK